MGDKAQIPRVRGFTLIEMMITVAVLALLVGLVLPSYTGYIRRGKIATVLGELSAARVRLEQYYQDNRNYGSTATTCGVAMPTVPGFTIRCTWGASSTPQSFLVTADGLASAGLGGTTYTIDNADQQKTVQFEGAAVNLPCWIKKKGETC